MPDQAEAPFQLVGRLYPMPGRHAAGFVGGRRDRGVIERAPGPGGEAERAHLLERFVRPGRADAVDLKNGHALIAARIEEVIGQALPVGR